MKFASIAPALLVLAAACFSPVSWAQGDAPVTARSVNEIEMASNGLRLTRTEAHKWTAFDESHNAVMAFTETKRDAAVVYLLREDGMTTLQINLERRMVVVAPAGQEPRDLAPVTTATSGPLVNGYMLTEAAFAEGKARFVSTDDGLWTEYGGDGEPLAVFKEEGRDDWSVYLFDAGRNLRIQLDVWRRMVGISVDGKPMEDFHPITRVSAAG